MAKDGSTAATTDGSATGSGDIARSLELLWGTGERPSRGPKPGLTLDRIVTAAIAVADAEGLSAVSMRRLSTELGTGTMSLYRYVPGKAELLDLMLDRVLGEPLPTGPAGERSAASARSSAGAPAYDRAEGSGDRARDSDHPAEDPGDRARDSGDSDHLAEDSDGLSQDSDGLSDDWRAAVDRMARGHLDNLRRHPWLLKINQARTVLGPSALRGLELALSGLRGMGLRDPELIGVIITVNSFVEGLARTQGDAAEAVAQTGLSDEEFWDNQRPYLERAMLSGEYPVMAAMAEDTFSAEFDHFEFGLQRLIAGFEALVRERRAAQK
ncbi:TetR family transcriptional regulator [Streptomyces sp. WZ.A104]|uniref:TetR/AcrR family transcriptional regulator n=1 Tax=Streptomyces sp. WZ.A104 TaxID=2023771 RepID=UPI000BBC2757|nr:TetR/AcrR family transcriptional regulator [Streptomyces sp. WZ.A104]PCG81698.1 TetR family transcriptional regulator [Streptomyces sp. WZ.A104]